MLWLSDSYLLLGVYTQSLKTLRLQGSQVRAVIYQSIAAKRLTDGLKPAFAVPVA